MDTFKQISAFVDVATRGSLSAAARGRVSPPPSSAAASTP